MAATRGTQFLAKAGVAFTLHPYAYEPAAAKIGLQAAEALGLDPALTLKTLMIDSDKGPAFCLIPAGDSLSLKKAAAAIGAKSAAMMLPAKAEKISGYHVGGISPFGALKRLPVLIEASVCGAERVWINAGQRGLLLGIAPAEALRVLDARSQPLSA